MTWTWSGKRVGRSARIRALRLRLMEENPFCSYCGVPVGERRHWTLDHVIPRSRGGRTSQNNLVLSCQVCNQAKRDRTAEEWAADILAAAESVRKAAASDH